MGMLAERVEQGPTSADDAAYAFFQRRVKTLTGIDLTAYKSQQMRRRLGTLISRNKVADLSEYARILDQPARLKEFLDFFTINVSEFFRIPDKFEYLERHIVPNIMVKGREFRVWSAGCSNGSEPYSLAMMLEDISPYGRWNVLATDVDRTILGKAQKGEGYMPADIRNVSDQRLARYFQRDASGYRVVDSLKRRIRFKLHDLLKDPFESGFNLILCRHVVIYFTEEAKDILYKKFADSLVEGGVLFVGGTEIIPRARELGLETVSVSFYRKNSGKK